MFIREWKCTCPVQTEKDFVDYLRETGVKDTANIDGCTGFRILRRELTAGIEITLLTYWRSLEAMRHYAGADLHRAVLYPDDGKFRIAAETEVKIYQVVASKESDE